MSIVMPFLGAGEGLDLVPPDIYISVRVSYVAFMRSLTRIAFLSTSWVVMGILWIGSEGWSQQRKVLQKISPASTREPTLTIKTSGKTIQLSRSDLLSGKGRVPAASVASAKKNLATVVVERDPTYGGRKMIYQAIPVYTLLEGLEISQDNIVEYQCSDGFVSVIPAERLLNSSPEKSIAYLAIEPEKKWPNTESNGIARTAGPFYLIWSNPQASAINREEWANQVIGFEVKKSLKESYPKIFPSDDLSQDSAIHKGFKVFTQVCFACHTLNFQGKSHMGPDLNSPMNPTEYFKEGILQTFIRNPQNVRAWPGSIMPPFPVDVVSNLELENLVQYLKHMSTRKEGFPRP